MDLASLLSQLDYTSNGPRFYDPYIMQVSSGRLCGRGQGTTGEEGRQRGEEGGRETGPMSYDPYIMHCSPWSAVFQGSRDQGGQ
jgi:hypothetical protein